jgi:cobalt-zinc-cadmium efflux system membrane fusion protein
MSKFIFLLCASVLLVACSPEAHDGDGHDTSGKGSSYERGPNNGRLLRNEDFALEVTIYETNVPPQFRLYAYRDGKPVAPSEVSVAITLTRLGGEVDRFTFKPESNYLVGSGEVVEPHSFDVLVAAEHSGKKSVWSYQSYEGRVRIPADIAKDAGIRVEAAGPALIRNTARLMGTIELDADKRVAIRARFPGMVRDVNVQQGDRIRRGQTLALVEGNDSMRTYPITAPIDGIVLARNTNVGAVTGDDVLFELADPSSIWVELRAVGSDAEVIKPGQVVRIKSVTGRAEAVGKIQRLLPVSGAGQSVVARVSIPNAEGLWRPGMKVMADVTIDTRNVALAVKESGLQKFRDFTVVFAQVGEMYEVRMLELGDRDGDFAEVVSGLRPGTNYVVDQSFLIRQDIEKSGASHDH